MNRFCTYLGQPVGEREVFDFTPDGKTHTHSERCLVAEISADELAHAECFGHRGQTEGPDETDIPEVELSRTEQNMVEALMRNVLPTPRYDTNNLVGMGFGL